MFTITGPARITSSRITDQNILFAGDSIMLNFSSRNESQNKSATKMVELIPNGDGIKIYKSRDGKQVVVLHKHPGIRGYHNPSTRHKDPNERHDPDNIAPDFN